MEVQALNNNVTLEMLTEKKDSLIDYNDLYTPAPRWGTVLSVGPGAPDYNGKRIPTYVKKGDMVYVMSHGRKEIQVAQDTQATFASELDLLAICSDTNNVTLQPLGAYIEVESVIEELSDIIDMPDSFKILPSIGRVKSVGPGWMSMSGERVPPQVEVGDIITYDPMATMNIDLRPFGIDEPRMFILEANILGKVYR